MTDACHPWVPVRGNPLQRRACVGGVGRMRRLGQAAEEAQRRHRRPLGVEPPDAGAVISSPGCPAGCPRWWSR